MTLDDDQQVYLEKYKAIVQHISYQGVVFWTVFSIFMAANAIMFVEYVKNLDSLSEFYKVRVPLYGILISIFWLLISGRDITLRHTNIEKAKRLLEMIDKGATPCLEIWDKNREIEGKVLSFRSLKGLSGIFETVHIFLLFIYLIIALWLVLLMKTPWAVLHMRSWGIEFEHEYIRILIALGAFIFWIVDYKIRKNAIDEFREKRKSKKNESEEEAD